ncbi:MAG TPA: indolepyruvate oxidoreductase subunit beta [Anaerolineaceae bacterium]
MNSPVILAGSACLNVVFAGVGGQGTILASDILAEVGSRVGLQVKKAEVHGMSQRGGTVISHVRIGPEVYSPIIARGSADILLGFEKLETLRAISLLRPGRIVISDRYQIPPITVSAGSAAYPADSDIHFALCQVAGQVHWVSGMEIARDLGNIRTANVVLLGALAALLEIPRSVWQEAVEGRVPLKHREINRQAFEAGFKALTVDPALQKPT